MRDLSLPSAKTRHGLLAALPSELKRRASQSKRCSSSFGSCASALNNVQERDSLPSKQNAPQQMGVVVAIRRTA